MVNSGGVNPVVLRVRAEKLDGARLEFIVHQSDQAIAVACDIKSTGYGDEKSNSIFTQATW